MPKSVLPAAALLAVPAMGSAQAPAVAPAAADPQGKAILDAQFPGMTAHESCPMFRGMSRKQVQPNSGGRITDEQVAADLAKLK